ncbi:MAG: hypothetical protein ACRDK2_11675 [Solirubrobacteraceae bacterium]
MNDGETLPTGRARTLGRVLDFTLLFVLMILVAGVFGGLQVSSHGLSLQLRDLGFLAWVTCIGLYYYVPKRTGSMTPGQRLSYTLANR